MDEQARIATIFERFEDTAPEENTPGRRSAQIGIKIRERAFKSLVSVMLSAQSRDAMTAKASAKLFAVADTPQAILGLSEERIAELIKDCGLYRMKARNLKRMCADLLERFDGQVPDTRADLMSLPGVGRKSADIMLRFEGGEAVVPVDTHVYRVSRRLGLAAGRNEAKVAQELEASVPEAKKFGAHIWLLEHGKRLCRSRKPLCAKCFLRDLCPSAPPSA